MISLPTLTATAAPDKIVSFIKWTEADCLRDSFAATTGTRYSRGVAFVGKDSFRDIDVGYATSNRGYATLSIYG